MTQKSRYNRQYIPHKLSILWLYILIMTSLAAQNIQVKAPATVYEGDRFTVTFSVNDKARNFAGPTFKGFSTLSGPSTSSSTSISFINGHQSKEVNTSFSYLLSADQAGTYTIGAATCVCDGNKISSTPFTIKVEKADPQRRQQQQQQQQPRDPWDDFFNDPWSDRRQQQAQQQAPQEPATIDSKSLFARASISKNSLYQGEQAIITYKIYTQVPITQYQIDKLPGNKGFWAEDLSEGKEIKQYEETIDGRRYQVAEIRRGALFGQENGKMTITPLNLDVLAMIQQPRRRTGTIWDLFDDPFFNRAQAVEKHLSTNAISVNVKPLPEAPEGFTGGVGSFNITGEVDTREVKANEAITYKVTISGSGNIMLINEPEITFSNAFEVYDPQIKDNINKSDGGISGSRTYEWVLIPRSQGEYEIPELKFAYFDPKTGQYVSKSIDAIPIKVDKGDPNAMQSGSTAKNGVQLLNSDINYIKTNDSKWQQQGDSKQPASWFWIGLCSIAAASIIVYLVGRKRQADRADVVGTKKKRATKEARKRLKKAAVYLRSNDDNKFYEEIYKAIWGCLSDHYNIPLSSLSTETVQERLTEHNVPEEKREQILSTLANVDYARFAPGDSTTKKQQIYDEAIELISVI